MKYILILVLLSSCNVLKTITDGKTKIDSDFFSDFQKPSDRIVVYACSSKACYFDTEAEEVFELGSDTGSVLDYGILPYNGKLLYTISGALYEYDFDTQTRINIESGLQGSLVEANGSVYFRRFDGFQEIASYNGATVTTSASTGAYANGYGIGVVQNGGSDRLILCMSGLISEVDLGDLTNAPSLIMPTNSHSGGSYAAGIPCSNVSYKTFTTDSGELISANFGTQIYGYSLGSNYVDDSVDISASTFNNIYENDKAIYFKSGGGYPYELWRMGKADKRFDLVSSNYDFKYEIIDDSEGNVYYMKGNSAALELVKFNIDSQTETNLVGLSIFGSVYHLSYGSKGLYIFGSSGIHRLDFDGKSSTLILNTTVDSNGFESISKDKIFN